jgi:hypothetical protein
MEHQVGKLDSLEEEMPLFARHLRQITRHFPP